MDILKQYVEMFNRDDRELYRNEIDNAHAYAWLKEEIPIFTCPDKDLERTYYFRFWTYRKHLKKTEDGYIITEFLPNVPWAGDFNAINAPFGFHLYEGRWLRNADKYLSEYTEFFLKRPKDAHHYSCWFADAVDKLIAVTGNRAMAKRILPELCAYYRVWEETHKLDNGMFWSLDGRDAMEFSISGRNERLEWIPGIRPTLNSYMCADALAIAKIAELSGEAEICREYTEKYNSLRRKINDNLYQDGFYRAFHHSETEELNRIFDGVQELPPRELLGYIPWMFNIPTSDQKEAFSLLASPDSFYTEYGPATAERSHPKFLYSAQHDCLWNGYVWPFATSQTLYALQNAIDHYGYVQYQKLYRDILTNYAKMHTRRLEDGQQICWIDESRHPLRDEWYTRAHLEAKGWGETVERGKDYNHSSFCDFIISGIVGVKASLSGELTVQPNIPEDWDYFSLSGLHYHGKCYDIRYDRESGLRILQK